MRIVTEISKGHFKVEYKGMSESEKLIVELIVEDMKSIVSCIINSHTHNLAVNQRLKVLPQEVVDCIDAIIDEINEIEPDSILCP